MVAHLGGIGDDLGREAARSAWDTHDRKTYRSAAKIETFQSSLDDGTDVTSLGRPGHRGKEREAPHGGCWPASGSGIANGRN